MISTTFHLKCIEINFIQRGQVKWQKIDNIILHFKVKSELLNNTERHLIGNLIKSVISFFICIEKEKKTTPVTFLLGVDVL